MTVGGAAGGSRTGGDAPGAGSSIGGGMPCGSINPIKEVAVSWDYPPGRTKIQDLGQRFGVCLVKC